MHSDTDSVKKSIRTYLMIGAALYVFTVITVAANQVHLAVPLAITVALIIAGINILVDLLYAALDPRVRLR